MTVIKEPRGNDESYSRRKDLFGKVLNKRDGTYVIYRGRPDEHRIVIRNGLIDNGDRPAIEYADGHTEFWKKGWPCREGAPAVISGWGTVEEYWRSGRCIKIVLLHQEAGMEEDDGE